MCILRWNSGPFLTFRRQREYSSKKNKESFLERLPLVRIIIKESLRIWSQNNNTESAPCLLPVSHTNEMERVCLEISDVKIPHRLIQSFRCVCISLFWKMLGRRYGSWTTSLSLLSTCFFLVRRWRGGWVLHPDVS